MPGSIARHPCAWIGSHFGGAARTRATAAGPPAAQLHADTNGMVLVRHKHAPTLAIGRFEPATAMATPSYGAQAAARPDACGVTAGLELGNA